MPIGNSCVGLSSIVILREFHRDSELLPRQGLRARWPNVFATQSCFRPSAASATVSAGCDFSTIAERGSEYLAC
ncbi:hypothetical protein RRG08_055574 [Elysia crispata]|uniref:Uncharacterized protein n=1 Tax=Elysia crispata TaxID=231223 RepID=A0AAE0ZRV1_9GAST|nr:hypothetical protein RRG08_055574 [Elysia crispata]